MDSSPKSAEGEGNSKETPLTIAKQKLCYFGKTEHTAIIPVFKYLKDIVKKKKEISYEDLDEVFSEQVERETIENLYEWFEENKYIIEAFLLSSEICQTVDGEEEDSDSDAKPLKLAVKKGEEIKVTIKEEEKEASDSKNRPLKLSANKRNSKKKDDGSKHRCGKNVAGKDQAKSLSDDDEMYSSPKSKTKPAKGEGNPTETPVTSGAKLEHNSYINARMYFEYQKDLAEKKKKITYVDLDEEILFPKPVKLVTFTEIYKWYEVQIFEDQIVEAALETCKKVDAKGEDCDSDGKPLKIVKNGEKRKVTIEEEEKEKVDAEGEDSESDANPLKPVVKKGEKSKVTIEEQEESDSENKPPKLSTRKRNLKKKADGSKLRSGKNVAEKNQDMDSLKSVTESAKGESSSKKTPVTSAKQKCFTSKKKFHAASSPQHHQITQTMWIRKGFVLKR